MNERLSKPMQVYFDEQASKHAALKRKRRIRTFWRLVACAIVAMIVLWWLANVGSPHIKYI